MKRVYSNIFRLLHVAIIAFLFSLTGCISEQFGPEDGKCPIQNKDAEVLLKISTPKAMPKTKMTDQEEKNIDQLVVLAFAVETSGSAEKEKFLYRAPIVAIEQDPHNTSITNIKVKLVVQDDLNQKVRLLIVANSEFKEVAKGTEKLAALEEYIYEYDAANGWTKNNIPMYGETAEISIKDGAVNNNVIKDIKGDNNIQLTRSLGKIHVTLDPVIQNFKLESVHVHRMANKYSVSHYWAPESITSINYNVEKKYNVDYSEDARGYTKNKIYVAERGAGQANDMKSRPCLVLGGKFAADGNFSGKKTTYYKVEFVKGDLTNPTYLPIKRNTVYDFQVSKISGDGFVDPDDALKSKGENIKCEIVAWDDSGVEKIVTDGEWMLAVSKDEFEFNREDDSEQIIVRTNWPDGWTAEVTEGASWLSIDKKKDVADKDCALNISVSELTQSVQREGKITIKAGRLSWILNVVQLPIIPVKITLYEDEECTKEVSFYALNPKGETKRLYVKYSPKVSDLDFDSASGTNFTWTKIDAASRPGLAVYEITSVDISNSDDDFDTRTDVRRFQINAEGKHVSATMFVQQMKLNAVPYDHAYDFNGDIIAGEMGKSLLDDHGFYSLDGKEKFFYMKANTPYELKLIENKSSVTNDELIEYIFGTSASGTPSKSSLGKMGGEKVKFTPYDDLTIPTRIYGEATFEIISPEHLFDNKTFTVTLSSGAVQPESNCYILKTGLQRGILIPVSRVNTAADWYKPVVDEVFDRGCQNPSYSREHFYLDRIGQDDEWTVDFIWAEVCPIQDEYAENTPIVGDNNVLKKVSRKGKGSGYIYVQAGTKTGNVCLAIKNRDGKILWSWHLWVLNEYPWHDDLRLYTSKNTRSNHRYLYRDLGELGPHDTNTENRWCNALVYQWGRKDPFPLMQKDLSMAYYNGHRRVIQANGQLKEMRCSEDTDLSINGASEIREYKFTISNPDYAISCGRNCVWYKELNKNSFANDLAPYNYSSLQIWSRLWGGRTAEGRPARLAYDMPTEKTPFDPSPYGWKVPNTGMEYGGDFYNPINLEGKESSICWDLRAASYDYCVNTLGYNLSYRSSPFWANQQFCRLVSTAFTESTAPGAIIGTLATPQVNNQLVSRGGLGRVRSVYNEKEADFWKYLPDANKVGRLPK